MSDLKESRIAPKVHFSCHCHLPSIGRVKPDAPLSEGTKSLKVVYASEWDGQQVAHKYSIVRARELPNRSLKPSEN